jgi:hypothetical protein
MDTNLKPLVEMTGEELKQFMDINRASFLVLSSAKHLLEEANILFFIICDEDTLTRLRLTE